MRILHTADWHLGHTLHGISRDYEHRCFLNWLLEQLEQQQVDALLICGDVFDTANPSAAAQHLLYDFLARAGQRCPQLEIVVIAGNHDSPSRLQAPAALLKALRISVIGTLPRTSQGEPDAQVCLIPLHNCNNEIAAWCAAVPFLRPADLPLGREAKQEEFVQAIRDVYQKLADEAQAKYSNGAVFIATAHCHTCGAQISERSERKIFIGNQHALPVDIFPDTTTYAALGHLHRAQSVGGQEHIRYSGSPIPLALNEATYKHQVLLVDVMGNGQVSVEHLSVPRAVKIMRVPAKGFMALNELADNLAAMVLENEQELQCRPFLEVAVRLNQPYANLHQDIEKALAGKAVRLLKISVEYTGSNKTLGDNPITGQLRELQPEDVFRLCHQKLYEKEPDKLLLQAFHELLETEPG